MLISVASTTLPAHERVVIRKNHFVPPSGENSALPRLCIVTGIHGDEHEGQYICCRLAQILEHEPESLTGVVDLYPAANPLGLATGTRGMGVFDLDLNHVFPGRENGPMPEYMAFKLMEDLKGASCVIDIHSPKAAAVCELPQIRICEENAERLLPLARRLNADFVWQTPLARESALAVALNLEGIPAMTVKAGSGLRLMRFMGDQLVEGILSLMEQLGIRKGETALPRVSAEVTDSEVLSLRSDAPGLFVAGVTLGQSVAQGESLGDLFHPYSGERLLRITAPRDGVIMTLRESPVCYEGCLIARIAGGGTI